jgi:ribosomal protein S27AE
LHCQVKKRAAQAMGKKGFWGQVLGIGLRGFVALMVFCCLPELCPAQAPSNEECFMCHGDPDLSKTAPDGRRLSLFVDQKGFESSVHQRLSCVLCHSDIMEVPHKEGALQRVECGKCHSEQATEFLDSIHFRSIRRGDVFAPGCKDCHGKHDVRSHEDPLSRSAKANVPNLCGTCHEGIKAEYQMSYHGQLLAQGDGRAPGCQDCHYSHRITQAEGRLHRLAQANRCGSCHKEYYRTFRDTFHGKLTSLGELTGAKCHDCHSAHSIFPERDIRSTVHRQNLLHTCRRCHTDAPENFISYIPHADIHDPGRPLLYYANLFMVGILVLTFGFFGLHSLLWLQRLTVEWIFRKRKRSETDG